MIQVAQDSERRKLEEMRQMKEMQDAELKDVKRMAKTEILKLIDEVRSKDRSIMELESQVKKLSEEGHRVWLKEEASRGKWLDAKDRRQAARVSVLQGKLSQ